MIIASSDLRFLLYIEPTRAASPKPVIDSATRRMAGNFRQARLPQFAYRGVHTCTCGASSTNVDYLLPSGVQTNSLCVHYLAHHRDEVPPEQLQRVLGLQALEAEPTQEELAPCFGSAMGLGGITTRTAR